MSEGLISEQTKRVARPKKNPEDKRESLHTTVAPAVKARLVAIQGKTGLDVSKIVERALLRALPVYEKDPGEILRDGPL